MQMKLKFKILFIFVLHIGTLYSYRDPFSFEIDHNNESNQLEQAQPRKLLFSDVGIKILAILNMGNKVGAILQKQDQQEVVFVGDKIWNYTVKKIELNEIVLINDNREIINLFFES